MTHGSRAGMIFFLAAASIGLIFDGAGLGRMTLCAALLHEAGHIAVYVLCAAQTPGFAGPRRRVCPTGDGIALQT